MSGLTLSIWVLVFVGALGIPAATSIVLYRGAIAAGVGRAAAIAVAAATAVGLGGWLAASAALARAGVYDRAPGAGVPWLPVASAATLIALLLAARIPVVSRILSAPGTPARLALPHTFRVAGLLFLLAMAQGRLPAAFALPAGLGDIAIGVSAPFVARRLARDGDLGGALRFNLLGILDLVVALTIGFLLFGFVPVTPTTEALGLLPLALVPTVPVPLAAALHLVSLSRLRTTARRERDRAGSLLPAAG